MKLTTKQIEGIASMLGEKTRLKNLSNKELVNECLKLDFTDHPVIDEMFNRLWPEWMEEDAPNRQVTPS